MIAALRVLIIILAFAPIPTLISGLYYLAAAEVLLIIAPYIKSMKLKVQLDELARHDTSGKDIADLTARYRFWQSLTLSQLIWPNS